MRCAPVIVLLASSTVSQGIQQLKDVADGRQVVVVREHDGEFYYYVFVVGAVRLRLVAAISPDLASALHLDELPPASSGQLSGTPPPVGGVVLEGREVVGVIVGDSDEDHEPATRGRIALPRFRPTREAGINFGSDTDDYADLGEDTRDPAPHDPLPPSPPMSKIHPQGRFDVHRSRQPRIQPTPTIAARPRDLSSCNPGGGPRSHPGARRPNRATRVTRIARIARIARAKKGPRRRLCRRRLGAAGCVCPRTTPSSRGVDRPRPRREAQHHRRQLPFPRRRGDARSGSCDRTASHHVRRRPGAERVAVAAE